MEGHSPPISVAALYQFARFDDPADLRARLTNQCRTLQLRGTLLIAHEGINGTVAGAPASVDALIATIRALPGCAALEVKYSRAHNLPFHRMKVRVKAEIVTMGQPDIDPLSDSGHYVDAEDWNALIADPEVIVIDTRNDYEVAIGSFPRAINPQTASFREFPDWFRANRDEFARAPKIAMFCTGGIRCEKATAFARSLGVDEVYHLKGGILRYLETVKDSAWHGECFVFDERVAVGPGLAPGTHDLCRACRMPVSSADKASPHFVEGVACARCCDSRDETQRAGYAERHRQVIGAEKRGEQHIGGAVTIAPSGRC